MDGLPCFNKSDLSLKKGTICRGMLARKCQKYSYACLLVFWWWYIDISVHIKQTTDDNVNIKMYLKTKWLRAEIKSQPFLK